MAPFWRLRAGAGSGLATAWAVRGYVGQGEPEPVAANAPVVERLVAAEDLAAGTRLDESHLQRRQVPAAWAPVPAWIRWRRKHCLARCCQRISMQARSSCRHICWANPPGGRRRRLRLAALPAGMRALNVTVADLGPLAGRLRVGDSVDVYASFVHDGKRNAAPVLLAAGPVRRRVGRRWRAGHGERHAGGPPRGCPALRRSPTGAS